MKRARLRSLAVIAFALLGMSCSNDRKNNNAIPKTDKASEVSPNYEVRRFVVNIPYEGDSFDQNIYLLSDKTSKQGLIIDPGFKCSELETAIASSGITIKGILNTHGHFDHTGANGLYRSKYRVDVYAHSSDKPLYQRREDEPTRWIAGDCNLQIGDVHVHVFHTPGHSPGSVSFQIGNHLFSGDALFQGTIGLTPDDAATVCLVDAIRKKLLTLPPEIPVYPGHDELTTIGVEKRDNPFLQNGQQDAEGDAVNRAP